MQTISLIGVPTDAGAGIQGSDLGPDALRRGWLGSALKRGRYGWVHNPTSLDR